VTERDLRTVLLALGLTATADGLDDLIALATKKRFGPRELFEHVAAIEEKDRAKRGLDRRIKRSRLERFKPMADFDWGWPKKIDRPLVESVLRLDFLTEPRNVVLAAAQGLGKTMIAQNIGHNAVLGGHGVLFISAAQLLLDLGAQESARTLERRLKHYTKVGLLILDEIGFLAFDSRNADLLFQVISRRYEKKSTVLTTNLAFRDWPTIFPNATCATALIDRVVHHADVIAIEGESYRAREADAQAKARRSRRKEQADPDDAT
jgi:DNA replication protein DnaC